MSTLDDEVTVDSEDVPPFTMCPHWVLFSDLSPQSKVLWWALAAHVYRSQDGDLAWPSRKTLADVLGLSRPQSIDQYLRELDEHGAISIEAQRVGGMKVRHRYRVRFKQPAGRSAPTTVEQFYRRRRAAALADKVQVET